jgi:hypothetical protein
MYLKNTVLEIIPDLEDILYDNGCKIVTDDFVGFKKDDEIYFIHLPSGIIINYYKHLGRTNTCNRSDLTLEDFKEFLKLLDKDLQIYRK